MCHKYTQKENGRSPSIGDHRAMHKEDENDKNTETNETQEVTEETQAEVTAEDETPSEAEDTSKPKAEDETPNEVEETPKPEAETTEDNTQTGVVMTKAQAGKLAMVSLVLCAILLTPAVLADYYCSKLLSVKKVKHSRYWIRKMRSVSKKYVELYFEGRSNTLLKGELHTPWKQNKRLVILVHDHGTDRWENFDILNTLLNEGFDVFTFDQRGHGESKGRIPLHLNKQADDISRAYNYLRKLYPNRWQRNAGIVAKGTGAGAAIFAASNTRNLKALVLFDPILDLKKELTKRLNDMNVPEWLQSFTLTRVSRVASLQFKYSRPARKAPYMYHTAIKIISSKPMKANHPYRVFCKGKRGQCRLSHAPLSKLPPKAKAPKQTTSRKRDRRKAVRGPSWWKRLPKQAKKKSTRFLSNFLGVVRKSRRNRAERIRRARKRRLRKSRRRAPQKRTKRIPRPSVRVYKNNKLRRFKQQVFPSKQALQKKKAKAPTIQKKKAKAPTIQKKKAKAPTIRKKKAKAPAPRKAPKKRSTKKPKQPAIPTTIPSKT
ncbi:MAG: hypothetical protein CL920_21960 [Deltaproteobacteria bacterium]|nr:hypothetical protein [Deltaproteobacteria bacterium]|tara:strand:+ start:1523 stop:3160 length:1638 start_codon:yes stop_codon:yes gene_type:complete